MPKGRDYWIDFNDVRDGRTMLAREHAAKSRLVPTPGLVIVVGDDDGTRALAVVETVTPSHVGVRLERVLP